MLGAASAGLALSACRWHSTPGSAPPTAGTRGETGQALFGAFISPILRTGKEALGFQALNQSIGGLLRGRRFYFYLDDAGAGILTPSAMTSPAVRPLISVISAIRAPGLTEGGIGVPWASVASGQRDEELRALARVLSAVPTEFDFAFHHEPNDDRSPHRLDCGQPADFVAANRHVHRFLLDQDVERMQFGVVFSRDSGTYRSDGTLGPWYPGDDVVDWLGFDGYSYAGTFGAPSLSFFDLVQDPVRMATAMGKPLKIAETNCLPDPHDPERKPGWYREIPMAVRENPSIKEVLLFTGGGPHWRIADTPEVFEAFLEIARDPVFGG